MQRSPKLYVEDILDAISKILDYTKGISYEHFTNNSLILDGTVRNLQIVGEAVKNLPDDAKKKHSEIEWKKIAGMRDIIIHDYFGVDTEIIWDIVKNKLEPLKAAMEKIKQEETS